MKLNAHFQIYADQGSLFNSCLTHPPTPTEIITISNHLKLYDMSNEYHNILGDTHTHQGWENVSRIELHLSDRNIMVWALVPLVLHFFHAIPAWQCWRHSWPCYWIFDLNTTASNHIYNRLLTSLQYLFWSNDGMHTIHALHMSGHAPFFFSSLELQAILLLIRDTWGAGQWHTAHNLINLVETDKIKCSAKLCIPLAQRSFTLHSTENKEKLIHLWFVNPHCLLR